MAVNLIEDLDEKKDKHIICFGSGSYFQIMYHDLKSRNVNFKVEGIIDNNPDKIGKKLMSVGDSIPILSVDDVMATYKAQDIVLLITTAFHQEIVKQLSQLTYFDEVETYSYYDIKKNDTEIYDKLDVSLSQPIIPKKIHYCWFSDKEMPIHLQREVDNWHKLCPDYEFICWNEKNYDINKTAYTKNAYNNKRWAHLPDYVRLDVVYQHGGIYMDTDVELIKSLDNLRCNEAFFGTEVTGGINEGSGFGAVKNHKFIQELMKVYETLEVDNPLFNTTSLGKEIEVFHKHGYKNNGKYQLVDDVAVYPYQVLAPMIKETGECMKTSATVAIHHFEGSWC